MARRLPDGVHDMAEAPLSDVRVIALRYQARWAMSRSASV